ncbi:SLC13 family permease [Algoriphagus boritolerans]|uniref:Di-and tricarboxylate transporter n=1 Tax=Algoriphagus boritolerans DSM 17298 = JCM 18970 TaxID=1120964 RepID=A0A1H5TGX0_9BACT|nr:SLC13 family permease [Algoriphagus boritolerans]SEF62059.1 Di-and tricarboxylate transporter [Algoriphagus boritolerans DSM 17298 = JCM 18970]
MTQDIWIVYGIISLAVILFFTEKFTIDTVAIGVMVLFMLFGILDLDEGLAGFSNSATITVASMFVISQAIFRTGILNQFSNYLSNQAEKSESRLILSLMISAGLLSAVINDTAVVALLMPSVIHISKKNQISSSKLLMPLSFGALMGGICTLLGTSTNILVSGIAEKSGLPAFGVFEMSKMGLVFLAAGILYMLTLGKWLLPKRKAKSGLSELLDLGNYVVEVTITEDYENLEEPILKQKLFKDGSIKALQIVRENGTKVKVYPNTPVTQGDVIRIICDQENLSKLKKVKGIEIKAELDWKEESVTDEEEKLFEAVITPHSYLINKSIKSINFRHLFDQVLVVGIRHRAGLFDTLLSKATLKPGDILLLRASEESIQSVDKSEDLLLISARKVVNLNKTQVIMTLSTLALVIGLAAFGVFPITLTAVAGAIFMIILRSISPDEAYKAIDWKVIFMLAGVLSMGSALEKTGGAALIGEGVVTVFGSFGPRAVLSAIFGLTFLLTNVMSNNASAALLAPIAISIAAGLNVDSRPFLMAVTFAASLSFMTPMGYQTNTMIYNPGNYRFTDFLKVGTPLNILFWILATFGIPIFFPF